MRNRAFGSGMISLGMIAACSQEIPNSSTANAAGAGRGSEAQTASPDAAIAARVRSMIAEHLGIDARHVRPGARLIEDLGADSLDIVELVMAFEQEFGISIPNSDVSQFKTVGGITRYLGTKAGPAG